MGSLDIFQALTEDRPYRERLDIEAAFRIMSIMAEEGELNMDIVDDLQKVFTSE